MERLQVGRRYGPRLNLRVGFRSTLCTSSPLHLHLWAILTAVGVLPNWPLKEKEARPRSWIGPGWPCPGAGAARGPAGPPRPPAPLASLCGGARAASLSEEGCETAAPYNSAADAVVSVVVVVVVVASEAGRSVGAGCSGAARQRRRRRAAPQFVPHRSGTQAEGRGRTRTYEDVKVGMTSLL